MSGAINFLMSDVYGGVFGTTELTIPEANDQKALVDDQKAAEVASPAGQKRFPMGLAVLLIIGIIIISGAVK